jgi:cell wall-associated NlpC family hydrolase
MIATAQNLIDQARKMVGTKWLHQGRSPGGVDCIGFLDVSAKRAGLDFEKMLGINLPVNYGRHPQPDLLRAYEAHATRIDKPIPGAVLLMQFNGEKYPRHVALYTERATIIHANAVRGVIVEHGYRAAWPRWTHSIWRLPGLDYGTP